MIKSTASPDTRTMAPLAGDKIPSATFKHFDASGSLEELSTDELCAGGDTITIFAPLRLINPARTPLLKPATPSPAVLWAGKKVVIFAVPGAFTPTCSKEHAPGAQ